MCVPVLYGTRVAIYIYIYIVVVVAAFVYIHTHAFLADVYVVCLTFVCVR